MIKKFKEALMSLLERDDLHPAANDNPSILLAVSGGIDSMCMLHLFHRIYYANFAIATVNFSLRGEESDEDEEMVQNWAAAKGVKCYSTQFDTKGYANQKGISTQMAARELRYEWFYKIMDSNSFDYLAIAHNLNDSVETFFINILRGTGINGLTGIKRRKDRVIRPLIGFTRREIAEFVKEEGVPFREDSSNIENHYSRNRIRNMIFPEFEMINSSFLRTVERDMQNIEAASDVLEDLIKERRSLFFEGSSDRISIERVMGERRADFWLYSLLSEYGFNALQTEQIMCALKGQPGKEFHSESHLLIKDREYLLLYPKGSIKELPTCEREEFTIDYIGVGDESELVVDGLKIFFRVKKIDNNYNPKKKRRENSELTGDLFGNISGLFAVESEMSVDSDKLQYPLVIRRWTEGDRFMPLGMTGFKKVSDYLTDIKLDKNSKERQYVLLSGDKIIALLGLRIDERFKITSESRTSLDITIV